MTAVSGNPVLWGIHTMDDPLFFESEPNCNRLGRDGRLIGYKCIS